MQKEHEKEEYTGPIEGTANQQDGTQQHNDGNTVLTAEDEIILRRLKAMEAAGEEMVVFPEDIHAVGIRLWPGICLHSFNDLMKHPVSTRDHHSMPVNSEWFAGMQKNLREVPDVEHNVLELTTCTVYVSFRGNPSPIEAYRKLLRNQERIVVRKKSEAWPRR